LARTPIIMIGIGAQKSGTSWLYHQLRAHPDCYLRAIKERHYFDKVMVGGGMADYRRWLRDEAADWRGRVRDAPRNPWSRRVLGEFNEARRAFSWPFSLVRPGDATYLHLLLKGWSGQQIAGEFTPAYATLPPAAFSRMMALAPDVRLIYVLRDPVARVWSAVRMALRKDPASRAAPDRAARHLVQKFLAGKSAPVTARSDYAATLGALAQQVEPGRYGVFVFDDLVQPGGLRPVTDFLGIPPLTAAAEVRRNEGPKLELDPVLRARLRRHLQPQYDAVERHFGRLPGTWMQKEAA
jgi:hypothetical protein